MAVYCPNQRCADLGGDLPFISTHVMYVSLSLLNFPVHGPAILRKKNHLISIKYNLMSSLSFTDIIIISNIT